MGSIFEAKSGNEFITFAPNPCAYLRALGWKMLAFWVPARKINFCSRALCPLIHTKQGSVKKEIGSYFMEAIDSLNNRRYFPSAAMFHALCLDARTLMALSKRAWNSGPETPDPLLPL